MCSHFDLGLGISFHTCTLLASCCNLSIHLELKGILLPSLTAQRLLFQERATMRIFPPGTPSIQCLEVPRLLNGPFVKGGFEMTNIGQ